jgi:Ca-activated chloride channel family protein
MTVQPVMWPVLLAVLTALIIAGRIVAFRQLPTSNRTARRRWAGISAAAVLLVIAAVRPVIATEDQAQAVVAGAHEPNIFLVVDRSPDMSVADIEGQPRIGLARNDIDSLIDRYPNARFAVIEFSATAALDWPLSADTWSLRPVVASLNPIAGTPDGLAQVNVGAANTVLRYQLIGAAAQYPSAPNLVFYLGAGAPESAGPAKEFDLPADSVDGGAVLGYGTDTGSLPTVAKQIGVPFVPRTDGAPLANPLADDSYSASAVRSVASAGGTELYWLPALGAAVLVLIELYLALRDFRRSRLTGLDVPR